jgi:hypothetical protein
MKHRSTAAALLALGTLAACAAPDAIAPRADAPALATSGSATTIKDLDPQDDGTNPDYARVARIVDRMNTRLAKSNSRYRLNEVSFFLVGRGTDPYRRLRTGSRWNDPTVTYMIDESDIIATGPYKSTSVSTAQTIEQIKYGYEVWNKLGTTVSLSRVADVGGNPDILDGQIREKGVCVDVVDLRSPVVIAYDSKSGSIDFSPVANNVFGGWLPPDYFADCLGSQNIIGVTWSFSDADSDGDQYADRLYTEMYYNTRFQWVTSGSPFLSSVMDVASIVAHEAGHSFGLGHFGGPNANEPFKLQPNGNVFDPTAVMNPFYIGGTKREPLSSDVSALTTLYQQNNQ